VLRRPVESAFAAAIGVEDHPGHLAAAHRQRHRQRFVGQVRVVPLAQGEAMILWAMIALMTRRLAATAH
jgi:hypothetical protein